MSDQRLRITRTSSPTVAPCFEDTWCPDPTAANDLKDLLDQRDAAGRPTVSRAPIPRMWLELMRPGSWKLDDSSQTLGRTPVGEDELEPLRR